MELIKTCKMIVDALSDRKGYNIKVIDIKEISSIGDYIIIADGDNKNQIQAMCDNVLDVMFANDFELKNKEGYANGGWILLDFCDIIVHIFSREERSFYDLDHIWRDGNIIDIGDNA